MEKEDMVHLLRECLKEKSELSRRETLLNKAVEGLRHFFKKW